ncbi:MAG: hypothetical protein ABSD64_01505 [Terriglobales bacterium]|jgi:hypothetical protein
MFKRWPLLISLLLLSGSIFCHAVPIDAGLFTTYSNDDAKTTLYWTVCGSIPPGEGCYGFGQLGPFGQIGSIVEGSKVYNNAKGTITRHLYVIDQAYGSGKDGVALYDYKRVDSIVNAYDTTTLTLVKTVSLPLTGGSSATVFMGANKAYLVIATSMSDAVVEVAKSNHAVTPISEISQIPTSITADNYGFVTVTSPMGFFVIGPNGAPQEFGGGSPFTVNTILGIQP